MTHSFLLVNVGRFNACGPITVTGKEDLLAQVKRHLMSRHVSISPHGTVFAGVRPVGRVEPFGGVAAAELEAWWRGFQGADVETRRAMLLPETGPKKRRRRRRKKPPSAAASPEAA